jgi:hypothetical protein
LKVQAINSDARMGQSEAHKRAYTFWPLHGESFANKIDLTRGILNRRHLSRGARFAVDFPGMATSSQLDRFIAAVHRRMLLLRAAERLGLCLLGGCIVLFILMPILIWRGQSTGELALITLGLALIAGIAWAITARPGKLAAAMEADRQLKLSDLLGSALLLRRLGAHDDIEKTVLTLAEARCAQFSPSTVVLHRLGSRGWGGIGLAAALVGGLCLMGPDNSSTRAVAAGPKSWQETELENEKANATHLIAAPDMRRVKEGTGADDDPKQSNTSEADPTAASANAANNNAPSNNDAGGAKAGTGAGASQSASKTKANPAGDPTAAGISKTSAGGTDTAGGGGTAAQGNLPGKTGSTAAPSKTHKAAPIWQSQSWPADQESARTALQNGKVPDAYRDLVRDYFERE